MPPPDQATPSTLAFHSSRIVIDLGVLAVMGSMSLPFVHAPGGDRSSLSMDALPALLLVLPVFAVTLIPDHARPLPRVLGWGALVLGLAAFPYSVVKLIDAGIVANSVEGTVGIGAYLLVMGTLVTVSGIAIGLVRAALGLPSGGNPAPPRHGGTREPPAVTDDEGHPFGGPLFESLETPALELEQGPWARSADEEPSLVFDFGPPPEEAAAEERHRDDVDQDGEPV